MIEGMIADAYTLEGKMLDYSPGKFTRYFGSHQFAYAAGINGIYEREGAAAGIYIGACYDETMTIPEIGHRVGALQIGGTIDPITMGQMTIMVDYAAFGEEIFALAADVTGDPYLKGAILSQDVATIVALALGVVGVLSILFGSTFIADMLLK
jgi:hypothetical protein